MGGAAEAGIWVWFAVNYQWMVVALSGVAILIAMLWWKGKTVGRNQIFNNILSSVILLIVLGCFIFAGYLYFQSEIEKKQQSWWEKLID